MKFLTHIAAVSILIMSSAAAHAVSIGTRLGGPTQSWYVGFGSPGGLQPIVGFDYLGLGIKSTMATEWEALYQGEPEDSGSSEATIEGGLRLLMPRLGLRYGIIDRQNLQAYVSGEGMLVLPMVSLDGEIDGESVDIADEDIDMIQDALGVFGLSLAFGTEYFLSDQFSVGADYGVSMLFWGFNQTVESSQEDWDYQFMTRSEVEASARLTGSFSRMSLNFHF